MFKLLVTTLPLLTPFVLAAPVHEDATPADLQNTVSIPVATSVAQNVSPESPLSHGESDAVRSSHFNPMALNLPFFERDKTSSTSPIDADNTVSVTSSTDAISDDTSDSTLDEFDTRAVGKRNVLYFTNW